MAVAAGGVRVRRMESEPRARETLENTKKQLKKTALRKYFLGALALVILVTVCVWFCYNKLFVLKKCIVEYDGELGYTTEEIMQGCGISYGMRLYEFSESDIQSNAKYNLPYIHSIEVKRSIPNKVVLKIVPSKPSFYTVIGNDAFVLSQDLKVLSCTDDFEYIESNKLVNVKIADVTSCIAGESLEAKGEETETLKQIYSLLSQNSILQYVDEIDVSNAFDLKFNFKSRYVVKLGDKSNLDLKIRFMISIEQKLNDTQSGIIDVSDENAKEGVVKHF